jgi:hypothetical protein
MEELKQLLVDANIPFVLDVNKLSIDNNQTSAEFFIEDGGVYGLAHQGKIGGTAFADTAQEAFDWMTNANEKMTVKMAKMMARSKPSRPKARTPLTVYNRSMLPPPACPYIVVDWDNVGVDIGEDMYEVDAVHLCLAPDQEIDLKMDGDFNDTEEMQHRAGRFLDTIASLSIASLITPNGDDIAGRAHGVRTSTHHGRDPRV